MKRLIDISALSEDAQQAIMEIAQAFDRGDPIEVESRTETEEGPPNGEFQNHLPVETVITITIDRRKHPPTFGLRR